MSSGRIGLLFPTLSGLSSAERISRFILVLRSYSDDSGNSDPPVFVLAGYVARAEQWDEFNERWIAALLEPRRLDYFKMKEAAALVDQFRGWTPAERDHKLAELISIIKETVIAGFASTVYHEDYRAAFAGKISREVDTPYWLMYHSMMRLVLDWQFRRGDDEKVSFIFDEQGKQTDQVQATWTNFLTYLPPRMKALMGDRPSHLNDVKTPPLQAADLLAWHIRRLYDEHEQGTVFSAPYMETLTSIPLREFLWTPEELHKFRSSVLKIGRESGGISPYQFAALERIRPAVISKNNLRLIGTARANSSVLLSRFPAKGMKRFLLVHSCPLVDSPHLHRRAGDRCLLEKPTAD